MKAYDYDAVICDGEVYCVGCVPEEFDPDECYPIFADSEWEYVPVCSVCGAEHDYVTVLESNPYETTEERLVMMPNPTAPKVSKYEGMTVEYTKARGKAAQFGQIKAPADVARFGMELGLLDETRERIYAIYCNQKNKPMGYRLVGSGSRSGCSVDPAVVFGPAVALHCSSIFLFHNHPSGNVRPSSDDRAITERLKTGGSILWIRVMDHVIVGREGFYSMTEDREFK